MYCERHSFVVYTNIKQVASLTNPHISEFYSVTFDFRLTISKASTPVSSRNELSSCYNGVYLPVGWFSTPMTGSWDPKFLAFWQSFACSQERQHQFFWLLSISPDKRLWMWMIGAWGSLPSHWRSKKKGIHRRLFHVVIKQIHDTTNKNYATSKAQHIAYFKKILILTTDPLLSHATPKFWRSFILPR